MPLGFRSVDTAKGATKATKTLDMPPPTNGSSSVMQARSVAWKLGDPATNDVQQGELANCPLAAILAALAHTSSGRTRINDLITEYRPVAVTTTLSKTIITTLTKQRNDPDYRPQDKEVASQRYFSVDLWGGIAVSDVFYVKYSDGNDVDMIYMNSPNQALWPCVIEKAYAVHVGSYEDLDDDLKHSANEFWSALVGKPPTVLTVDDKTPLNNIQAVAKNAGNVPTIAASRDKTDEKVDSHHGFAVLRSSGSTIELYDPHGKPVTLSLTDFRANFKAILYGSP